MLAQGIYKALFLLVVLVLVRPACGAEPSTDPAKSLGRLTFSTGKQTPYYRTYPLNTENKDIKRAVIVIHGLNRTADNYFRYAVGSAKAEGRLKDTIIVAPKFQIKADKPEANDHVWDGDWSQGDDSVDGKKFSSFEAVDQIVEHLTLKGKFPNLKTIVVAGHSAGGQFVGRYLAGGQAAKVKLVFLVMNPSSYLYVDNRRPIGGGKFAATTDANNKYKYGLLDLNSYLNQQPPRLRINIFGRTAWYLAGTADTGKDDLDEREPAMKQGKNRFERWSNFRDYVQLFPDWRDSAKFESVPGIAHSANGMLNSAAAKRIMFHDALITLPPGSPVKPSPVGPSPKPTSTSRLIVCTPTDWVQVNLDAGLGWFGRDVPGIRELPETKDSLTAMLKKHGFETQYRGVKGAGNSVKLQLFARLTKETRTPSTAVVERLDREVKAIADMVYGGPKAVGKKVSMVVPK